ncbi:MAG: metalloregulator ArsR/SmtB family transcription factor [Verrucomicrobiae bacterium]|nr:metalloregulator ArsR/SmtB family transcription factor [Verrucomicrobiae bacterium]NNJ85880.1 winged helix-turn-helix transcriptional regulator [Akkermansiaceae bacterium]
MAFAKTDEFNEATVQMAEFASALAHPARISILQYLIEHPGCRCTELVDAMPLSQPSCSRHLAELRKASLVEANQHGNEVHYSLRKQRIQRFCDAFHNTLSSK